MSFNSSDPPKLGPSGPIFRPISSAVGSILGATQMREIMQNPTIYVRRRLVWPGCVRAVQIVAN